MHRWESNSAFTQSKQLLSFLSLPGSLAKDAFCFGRGVMTHTLTLDFITMDWQLDYTCVTTFARKLNVHG